MLVFKQSDDSQWWVRLVAKNGEIVFWSETYKTLDSAFHAASLLPELAAAEVRIENREAAPQTFATLTAYSNWRKALHASIGLRASPRRRRYFLSARP